MSTDKTSGEHAAAPSINNSTKVTLGLVVTVVTAFLCGALWINTGFTELKINITDGFGQLRLEISKGYASKAELEALRRDLTKHQRKGGHAVMVQRVAYLERQVNTLERRLEKKR